MALSLRARRTLSAAGVTLAAMGCTLSLAAAPAFADTTTQAAALARAQVGDNACSTNTLGGRGFLTSCNTATGSEAEPWCADFVKWVWKNSGFNVSGTDARASSFYSYGQSNGTLHTSSSYQPQVGDAVVFEYANGWAQHVAMVTAVYAGGSIMTTHGNWSDKVADVAVSASQKQVGDTPSSIGQRISAYVTPLGATPASYSKGDRDFTGDLNDDLLGVSASDDKLRMYAGNGDGEFDSHEVGPGWGGMDKIKAADFNNDGEGDLVARNASTGDLYLYLGNGNGGFKSTTKIGTGWNGMTDFVAGDFTGDGKADIVAVRKDDATLQIYSGTGTDVTYTKQIGQGWSGMSKLAAGDFNGDGRADLVAVVNSTSDLNLYVGTSTGVAPAIQIGQNWSGIDKITLADIDSDGRADVVATIASTGDLYQYASMSNSLKAGVKIGQGWGGMSHLI
ncbi:FG-GAP-like repeat-containing protein [Streptomyces sp. NPDC048723]|uniref:FG-GAP-like repeat-containing protein n=1 Tax=Streptomyces sp. NPDC048723 TaxID=3365589 RepID=UPI003722E090